MRPRRRSASLCLRPLSGRTPRPKPSPYRRRYPPLVVGEGKIRKIHRPGRKNRGFGGRGAGRRPFSVRASARARACATPTVGRLFAGCCYVCVRGLGPVCGWCFVTFRRRGGAIRDCVIRCFVGGFFFWRGGAVGFENGMSVFFYAEYFCLVVLSGRFEVLIWNFCFCV